MYPSAIFMNLLGKRLVVFGCGYIGGEIARQALARGIAVVALTRNAAMAEALRATGVEVIVEDLATHSWHSKIVGSFDYLVNSVSSGGGGMEGYRRSYVGGAASIVAWSQRKSAPGTLVYTSSTAVYPQDGGVEVDESASTEGVGERGRLLLEAEALVRSFSDSGAGNFSRRSFILRLAGIYGPKRQHLVDQVRNGAVAGRGEHHLNLIHRDDVCSAIWAALEAPESMRNEIFNVADDAAAPKSVVVNWLAQRLGVSAPTFTQVPAEGRRSITPDRIIVNSKLKGMLGWQPKHRDFRSGYENMLALDAE
jgi:nucleoside-diphosphate-sugar epimerase